MSRFGQLVLPEDVLISPIAELPERVRERLEHEQGDCAVTRPRSRGRSTVVDAESARLLERFRAPSTIVEAVAAHSAAIGLDPRETLDSAFGMLSDLVADGLLLAADSKLAQPIATSLQPGEPVGAFELVEPVHLIVDTEIHLARAADGTLAAVKIARPGAERQLAAAIRHEAAILERLGGRVSPRLLEIGMHGERPFLALSWCAGADVVQAASEARELDAARGHERVFRLARDVVASYAALHAQGVAHGDVHPRNVLVEADGAVRLIDFGLAAAPAPPGTTSRGWRGGVDFFFEPERAAARLAGTAQPALSAAAEQYSVAALVYLLLTGAHTQAFSLEAEEMLRQLVELPPRPFGAHGVSGMPSVEAVVGRALAKDPAERHRSMAEFLAALEAAVDRDCRPAAAPPTRPPPGLGQGTLLEETIERLAAPDGELFAQGIPAPTASAMNGAAGFAYALLRIAGIREDESLLALADLWAVRARLAADSEEAFWSAELEIVPETFGENSFYHHLGGVECVLALVAAARGDDAAVRRSLAGFAGAAAKPCEQVDVAFGRAGLLLGASLLLDALPPHVDGTPLRAAGERLQGSLWDELARQPALADGPDLDLLGAAHGWAGCLFALLRWSEAAAMPPPPGLEQRLEELGAMARPIGRGLRWPCDAAAQMSHTGLEASWCNGAAGQVFLWTAAHRAFGEDRYARWAEMAGWTACESPAPAVGDLCCGFAGRAYALVRLYRHTGEEVWLARARPLAAKAEQAVRAKALRRDSLYKGEVGVALLAADLERPEHACMPLFDAEGGSTGGS